jgi:acyl carrier protein
MDVRPTLVGIFEQLEFAPGDMDDTVRFREDLDMDSTEFVELALTIEKRMRVPIDASHFAELHTFGDLVEFVASAPTQS